MAWVRKGRDRTLRLAAAAVGVFVGCTDVVVVVEENVSTPERPAGTDSVHVLVATEFEAQGAVSSVGHALEYQFEWGDGTTSPWMASHGGSAHAEHAWQVIGDADVRGRARCAADQGIVSSWSDALSVDVWASGSQVETVLLAAPSDTSFVPEILCSWIGTPDTAAAAYQYQLAATDSTYFFTGGVSGRVVRSVVPPEENPAGSGDDEFFRWTEPSEAVSATLGPLGDGWYEFRVRALDRQEVPDETPARRAFFVLFDDIPPTPNIVSPRPGSSNAACGRLPEGVTSWTFFLDATDEARHRLLSRGALQYSYRLSARTTVTCTTHLSDEFTSWQYFPEGTDPVQVGHAAPTVYNDLFDQFCGWDFTLRVRDPAGNMSVIVCCITKTSGC